nr:DUF1593 domain-containing protein [Auraticoccus cholistanensis]
MVSTDIGGTDPDDFQSMVHLLLYADRVDIEGLVASPYGRGRVEDILEVIDRYEVDHPNLRRHDPSYPEPDRLREVAKQGSFEVAADDGSTGATEGSDWIVRCARRPDPRPLDVLVWGGLDDVAQALRDAPDIAGSLRVHYIGGPNTMWGVDAYNYVEENVPQLRMIESNTTYRGFFERGDRTDDPDNVRFVDEHVAGHGALGDFFAAQLPHLKMGDSPTLTWLLHGRQDPAAPSWGGRFVRLWAPRKRSFHRLTTAADVVETNAPVEITLPRPAGYAATDVSRLVVDNRDHGPFPAGVDVGDGIRFRLSTYQVREVPYRVESSHPELDGLQGAFTAAPATQEATTHVSQRHPHWWCDDHDPEKAIGQIPGARWVSDYRAEFLRDFAERLDRCLPPGG